MVVWLSCYAFLPVVIVIAYDKMKRIFDKCCKKRIDRKDNIQLSKEEIEQLRKKEKEFEKNNKDIKEEGIKEKKE